MFVNMLYLVIGFVKDRINEVLRTFRLTIKFLGKFVRIYGKSRNNSV